MRTWLKETLNRRRLLWGSLAAAGGSLLRGVAATGQSPHAGHGSAPYEANMIGGHGAHGNMITVGDVGSARTASTPRRS